VFACPARLQRAVCFLIGCLSAQEDSMLSIDLQGNDLTQDGLLICLEIMRVRALARTRVPCASINGTPPPHSNPP
jgi:hypothetical protein